ncbi:hypothetical protein ACFSR7_20590 [Cohnella sp. GCM10020058]|uniref:hypothetical protein n=1 Tax=Cohnella sp. GCM10020058 TaxID=3317330 RepID=UPI003631AB3C
MLKSFHIAACLVIVLSLLTGCNKSDGAINFNNRTAMSTTPAQAASEPQPESDVPTSTDRGFDLLQQFLGAVRSQDSKKLTDLMRSTNPDYEQDYIHIDESVMKQFLKMLSVEIEPGTIQATLDESGDRQATYIVTGTKGSSSPVTINDRLYVSFPNGSDDPWLDWSYIRYLPYAEALAGEYIRLIQAGNAEQLARFSVVDDTGLTTASAKELITNYATHFNSMNPAELVYKGNFQFEVRDGSEKNHTFQIIYGDGLMGIDDTFAPTMTTM